MFKYFYYRLFKLYNEKEKGTNADSSATCALVSLQAVMLLSIYLLINVLFDGIIDISKTNPNIIACKFIGVFVIVFVAWCEYKYFKKKRPSMMAKYANHPANRWFRCWMLYVIAAVCIATPILLSFALGKATIIK